MSATGDSTRDWLLKKLLKASRNLAEQQAEIEKLKERLAREDGQIARLHHDAKMRVAAATIPYDVEIAELRERIKQLSPEKQFHVYLRTPAGRHDRKLEIQAVQSANGVTCIYVKR